MANADPVMLTFTGWIIPMGGFGYAIHRGIEHG